MANLNSLLPIDFKSLDSIWDKLTQLAGYRPGSPLSTFFQGASVTTVPYTLYVNATTGSDNNTGGAIDPFASIQAALDSIPKRLRHLVKIDVAAGNYTGFSIAGFVCEDPGTGLPVGIHIFGPTQSVTDLATGAATGTITSITAASTTTGTFTVWNDSGQAWTSDDLKGRFAELLKSVATIVCSSVLAGDRVIVNGVTFTAVTGTPGANQFDRSSGNNATATSLAAAVAASTSTGVSGYVTATASSATVTFLSDAALSVTDANLVTLTSSNNTRLAAPASGLLSTAGTILPITSNTATGVSVAASSNSATVGQTYAIRKMAAVITTARSISPSPSAFGAVQSAGSPCGINIGHNVGFARVTNFRVEMMKVALAASTSNVPVQLQNVHANIALSRLHIVDATTNFSAVSVAGSGQLIQLSQSVLDVATGGLSATGGTTGANPSFSLSSLMIKAGAGTGISAQTFTASNIQCDQPIGFNITGPGFATWGSITRLTGSSQGIRSRAGSGNYGGSIMQLSSSGVIVCTGKSTCIELDGLHYFSVDGVLTGTLNTTGISVSHGSRCRLSATSDVTVTGNALVYDGTTATLADMRGAAGKVLSSTLGSYVFE